MFIREGDVSLSASYQYVQRHTESASLTVWVGGRPDNAPAAPSPLPAPSADRLELSPERKTNPAETPTSDEVDPFAADAELDPQTRLAKLLLEFLTGKRIRILRPRDFQPGQDHCCCACHHREQEAERVEQRQGWGVSYTEQQTYAERQELSFSAEGRVRTRDGQEIRFSLELQASREFFAQSSFSFRAGDAVKVDPLVINFDGLATELTQTAFQFDLDLDGQPEEAHFVKPGSGFLVFDRNGDGQVGDGSELFGPQTGDGLAELAAYDADGNRWIDEADPVYHRLQIWTRSLDGADALATLKQAGVGAIYLGAVGSHFDLKDQANAVVGESNRFGIYLTEEGVAKSLQQIDLVV